MIFKHFSTVEDKLKHTQYMNLHETIPYRTGKHVALPGMPVSLR